MKEYPTFNASIEEYAKFLESATDDEYERYMKSGIAGIRIECMEKKGSMTYKVLVKRTSQIIDRELNKRPIERAKMDKLCGALLKMCSYDEEQL